MARPVRVELTTYSSGGCRSIHLSYGRAVGTPRGFRSARYARTTPNLVILSRMAGLR
jgi:hypothetical protein